MRRKVVAGNWKMNLTIEAGVELVESIVNGYSNSDVEVILATPYTYLLKMNEITSTNSNIKIAAQNCHHKSNGAYTGEVSASMLSSMKIPYVIIGHSERRSMNGETDTILLEKLEKALNEQLNPIFCCGEPLEIRKNNDQVNYVTKQLEETIFKLSSDQVRQLILAYEPIWAIGTGETASPEQAQEIHAAIRSSLSNQFGEEIANSIPILYGGSVKPENAKAIFANPDVDGGLVGGASLDKGKFIQIIESF